MDMGFKRRGGEPDVVWLAQEMFDFRNSAAVDLLRENFPDLKVRVINVVDLMTLEPPKEHPHGLSDEDFDALFTKINRSYLAFHGYPC